MSVAKNALRVSFATLVVAGAVLGLAAPAQAHNYLVASTPAANQTLTALPDHFSVTTNENLLDLNGTGSGFGIEIIDADGLFYGDGCVTVEGPSIFTTPAIGEPGTYRLVWQVISGDGHTVSEEFPFVWAPTGDYTKSTGTAKPGDCNGRYNRADSGVAPEAAASIDLSTVLWIGGALLAIGFAVVITLLLVRPKKK